jgi:hypothetical protein
MEKVEYCYVAKCLNMKCPRVWGHSREDCEAAMEQWTAKQVRFKPLGLYKYPLIHKGENKYEIDWGYEDDNGTYNDNGQDVL